jgi:hypothetical protein
MRNMIWRKMIILEYLYRDAGNFKAFGSVALSGILTTAEMEEIRARLLPDGLFIAEQLGIPPLYGELYRWSGGPTSEDHCWHELVDIRNRGESDLQAPSMWGRARDFLARIRLVKDWREDLSPHFRS